LRRIVHCSDFHFGAHDPVVAEALARDIQRARPHVVAVSGDLTQRARRREFRLARSFLESLDAPRVVVPGNHDIPFYDVMRRTFRPLNRFREHVTPDAYPWFGDDEVAVLGLNTARRMAFKNGRISMLQMVEIPLRFRRAAPEAFRIIVTHHSFVPGESHQSVVGRASLAIRALEAAGVELMLAGHGHQGLFADARLHHRALGRSILVAHAGTAISRRVRGEPNSFNVLKLAGDRVEVEVHSWDGDRFSGAYSTVYEKEGTTWKKLEEKVGREVARRAGGQPSRPGPVSA
jgi:3',5'-cyclic AMP phosphodiesterase CpdA